MSNIYINEPPTFGKVLLETSAGDIDIELWSKEAPKACRNFIQLCMEGYYDGLIFHRVVRDFIVQGGDPTGTGEGGESVYGKPFKDEFHSRIRFNRRGLVAMANAGSHDNGSQFFFTMAATPELQNKHTIFGKVTGNTVYNMLKLQESEVDGNERPIHPYKINKTQILSNPFDDIIPRVLKKKKDKTTDSNNKPKSQSKATKNFNLLSFGEEAEEDEEETDQATKDMKIKSKSSHDLIDDPKLSSKPALDVSQDKERLKRKSVSEEDHESDSSSEKSSVKKTKITEEKKKKMKEEPEEETKTKSRSEQLKEESKRLQKELRKGQKEEKVHVPEVKEKKSKNPALEEYKKEQEKYKEQKRTIGKKGGSREELTLMMLSKFKDKLESVKTIGGDYSDDEEDKNKDEEEQAADDSDLSWMRHKLQFDEKRNKVLDANVHDSDRYEIYDPRNPMTKRRRDASKQKNKDKS